MIFYYNLLTWVERFGSYIYLLSFLQFQCNTMRTKFFVLWYFTKWSHKTSLTPSLFIEVNIPGQESERSCIWRYQFSLFVWLVWYFMFFICMWPNRWIYQPLQHRYSSSNLSTVIFRYCTWRLQYIQLYVLFLP